MTVVTVEHSDAPPAVEPISPLPLTRSSRLRHELEARAIMTEAPAARGPPSPFARADRCPRSSRRSPKAGRTRWHSAAIGADRPESWNPGEPRATCCTRLRSACSQFRFEVQQEGRYANGGWRSDQPTAGWIGVSTAAPRTWPRRNRSSPSFACSSASGSVAIWRGTRPASARNPPHPGG